MTWVGYFEDIEESQIESLKRDNRQLEIIGANAILNNEESKRYLQHAKCYHEAGQKIEHRLLEIVTHPNYSNVLLIPRIKRLEKELSDSNRVILALREDLHKSGQKNTQLVSQIRNLERVLSIHRKESVQFRDSVNNHPISSVSKHQARKSA